MPKKEKKAPEETQEDRQMKILEAEVREIFDRVPQGSLVSSKAHALLQKLNKA